VLVASACDDVKRIENYTNLSSLSDSELSRILEIAEPLHNEDHVLKIKINQTTLFVKKIPLTDLEYRSENHYSTANLFNLPTYYQYGIGSEGFSAWRELKAHIITTNWVISEKCPNFPIMYHWRLLPNDSISPITEDQQKDINEYVTYWEGSKAIHARIESLQQSPAKYRVIFRIYTSEC
jgi:hypothetical protein